MIKTKGNLEGIVLIDKPSGITSHDVVEFARKKFLMRRIGHAGTLDPMATGVLILLLGKATKLSTHFTNLDKEYKAELVLGAETDTGDIQGKTTKTFEESTFKDISEKNVIEVLEKFKGKISQTPPMVSAIKINGKKLYELARKGIEVKRNPREITIRELELLNFQSSRISIRVVCSKGTYIRQLCEDIGKALGTGAYQSKLRRMRVGDFKVDEAIKLDELNESHIRKK